MSSEEGYVLKFISGKYQGGEFPLEMETEIIIGRSSELDMVLVEDMVSRRHARITSFHGNLMIEDFGSTNGKLPKRRAIVTRSDRDCATEVVTRTIALRTGQPRSERGLVDRDPTALTTASTVEPRRARDDFGATIAVEIDTTADRSPTTTDPAAETHDGRHASRDL